MGNLELNRVNSLIIGAGHNGLVCAAYLAKKGQSVLVLESSSFQSPLNICKDFDDEATSRFINSYFKAALRSESMQPH